MSFMYVDVSPPVLVKACERLGRGHRIQLNPLNFPSRRVQTNSQLKKQGCFFLHTIYACIAGKKHLYYHIPQESMWLCVQRKENNSVCSSLSC